MNRKKQFELTEEIKNKIIAAAYKDASCLDRISVWRLISKSEEAKFLFESYRATAIAVSKLSEEECPSSVIKTIEDKTEKAVSNNFINDLYSIIFARPAISLAMVLVIVSVITFGVIRNKTVEYEFTQEEVIEADKQAQQALAIVGNIFKQTKTTLENDVLGDKVAKPLNKGFGILNNIFEGEQNEIN
ncbi:MAG: hypothetical protein WCZ90_02365 [Melioribacteraceae bacterium]